MEKNGILEITNSFPFPETAAAANDGQSDSASNTAASAPRAKQNIAYGNEMIKFLREVNVDANNVGWYTSTSMGNFVNLQTIENQYFYQNAPNEKTVALVYDVSRSSEGAMNLRAYRLSPAFMTAYKESKFTTERYERSCCDRRQKLTSAASRRAASGTRTSSSSSPSPFATRTSSPLFFTSCPHRHPRRSSLSRRTCLPCFRTRTRRSRLSAPTTTRSTSPSIPFSRRRATCSSRASRTTTRSSTTTSTTNARSPVSRPRLPHGSRSARRRTLHDRRRSSHCSQRTSGRGCSSCPRSPAGWRRCSTPGKSSSTRGRWTASLQASRQRCSQSSRTFCRGMLELLSATESVCFMIMLLLVRAWHGVRYSQAAPVGESCGMSLFDSVA